MMTPSRFEKKRSAELFQEALKDQNCYAHVKIGPPKRREQKLPLFDMPVAFWINPSGDNFVARCAGHFELDRLNRSFISLARPKLSAVPCNSNSEICGNVSNGWFWPLAIPHVRSSERARERKFHREART